MLANPDETHTVDARQPPQPAFRPRAIRTTSAALALFALIVVLYGGYGHHWSWTGINGQTATLWDWLHLLLLPLAFGLLPVVISREVELRRSHRLLGSVLLGLFAAIVLAGYEMPWKWTGFTGNKLWDWLELLVLPLAIALSPWFEELRPRWSTRHWLITLTGLAVFAAIVIGGYVGNWRWTGFRGNTLWDWLQLLLLPLTLPLFIVPRLKPVAEAKMKPTHHHQAQPVQPGHGARR